MKKMIPRFKTAAAIALLVGLGQFARAEITGQWDFNGDLSATIGQGIEYFPWETETRENTEFGTTTDFGIPDIDGEPAMVMKSPKTTPYSEDFTEKGYSIFPGGTPQPDERYLNRYTIIMDVLFPEESSGKRRALLDLDLRQFEGENFPSAEYFVQASNGVGAGNAGQGNIAPNTWNRIALVVDMSRDSGDLRVFINGTFVGEQNLGDIDQLPWAADPFEMWLFSDDSGETEVAYINSLQFRDEALEDAFVEVLGGPTADGIPFTPPANPFARSISPSPATARFPLRSEVSPQPTIQVEIRDGEAILNPDSLELRLDDMIVPHETSKDADITTVTGTVTTPLEALSIHLASLTWTDADGVEGGVEWQFAIGQFVGIPADAAAPSGSGQEPGFLVTNHQSTDSIILPRTFQRALDQINGTIVNPLTGEALPDLALPGDNPDGSTHFDIIDFTTGSPYIGDFINDFPFPGIPGTDGHTRNFSTDVVTFLELTAGIHTLGVGTKIDRTDASQGGNDDGFVLIIGENPRDVFGSVIAREMRSEDQGQFARTVNYTEFRIDVPADGLYPVRIVHFSKGALPGPPAPGNSADGSALEFYSIDPDTQDKVLINDPDNPNSIKAFTQSTHAPNNSPYVASVRPVPEAAGIPSDTPIEILIQDGATAVNASTIQLTLNEEIVTPQTVDQADGRTTVIFRPNAGRTEVENRVQVTFEDADGTSFTRSWAFTIKPGTGVATPPVTGQWDFDNGLQASIGQDLEFLGGDAGSTAGGTVFANTADLEIPGIGGTDVNVMVVPGDASSEIGYIMRHGINPNGGGTRVNQYTLIYDIFVATSGPGFASLIQINDLTGQDDGDIFLNAGNGNFGQGGDGYNGRGGFTPGAWHRVAMAVDLAANPPIFTKYVDGIKQQDWTQQQLDQDRRALKEFAILFNDNGDERRMMYVSSIQVRDGKLSDAALTQLNGPSPGKIAVEIPPSAVTGQWDFTNGLAATVGADLEFLGGAEGATAGGTVFDTTANLGIPGINGEDARVMMVPGDASADIGYLMHHRIEPNGGGTRVNQYTLIYDIYVDTSGPGFASLIQINDLTGQDDGDIFLNAGNGNFGQGGDGYNGRGGFTPGAWHRVAMAVDLAANPPIFTKFVDGVKQQDWVQQQVDQDRRALKEYAILFNDNGDERRTMYVNSIQIQEGKLSDAQLAILGGPQASGVPLPQPQSNVSGDWDFSDGLFAVAGQNLEFLGGAEGATAGGTQFANTADLEIPGINGVDVDVMIVPGDASADIGYIMHHGIAPNGGGTRVNQYTLIWDIFVDPSGPGFASLIQINDLTGQDDGDIFLNAGNGNFGQGGDGYNGRGGFTPGSWHRVAMAVDLAANPPLITKFVDGIKQQDWTQQQLDQDRRALKEFAILFNDNGDERRRMYVSNVQIREGKLSDAQLVLLGGPNAAGIPLATPDSSVTGQWDFNDGLLATIGSDLGFLGGNEGSTAGGTVFDNTANLEIPGINGVDVDVMVVPGDASADIGYIMDHRIAPNGGGTRVNQYTLIWDIFVDTSGPGFASLIQINDLTGQDDGDIFLNAGNGNFGQGGDGYNGLGGFTPGAWHRVAMAVNLAANPPLITKFVDGIKQQDWVQQQLDQDRRALKETAILFNDNGDERRRMYVSSIQIREGKLSDADLIALNGPSPLKIWPGRPGDQPEPGQAGVALVISLGDGNVTLGWDPAVEGYRLDRTSDLINPDWQPVPGVEDNSVVLDLSEIQQFFRLIRE